MFLNRRMPFRRPGVVPVVNVMMVVMEEIMLPMMAGFMMRVVRLLRFRERGGGRRNCERGDRHHKNNLLFHDRTLRIELLEW